MTVASSQYETTGRYLGVTDGYFLYGELPNWVYCYCKPCWQQNILALSFIPNGQQVNTLQQQLSASQQNQTNLQQQLSASQQNQTNLQQQLNASRAESTSYKKQLDEMTERYNKLANISGIEKLRDLLKQLTSSQIDALHTHTKFRVDTFETVHGEQQLQCSTQFVQSILTQLKASVDAVVQFQKNTLGLRKQAKESVFQTLTTAGVPKAIIETSIKPLETEIEQIEAGIEGWNTFSAVLINAVNQSSPLSMLCTEVKEAL
jgi:chromosome segregation ATPase